MIWLKKFNKLMKCIIISLILSIVLVSAILPKNVSAKIKDVDCYLCKKDKDDPLYKKEVQFYKKIDIIKSIFGNKIDEIVLAATVLHKFDADTAYAIEYNEDFNEKDYRSSWQSLSDNGGSISNVGFSDAQADEINSRVQENRKVDLITTAAIVMLDSNNFGPYNEEAYKKALAGTRLFGNNDEMFGNFLNLFVCGGVQASNIISSPFEFISNIFNGGLDNLLTISPEVAAQTIANRVSDTNSVCQNGYIGGMYRQVGSIEDEDKKQKVKQEYAEDILKLANYYKEMYGQKENTCVSNFSGLAGEFSGWKQGDSRWSNINLGTSDAIMKDSGCTVTSVAMQIARSGTRLGVLPEGYTEFNPGAFVTVLNNNNGFNDASFSWTGFSSIAPNWRDTKIFKEVNTSSHSVLADIVSKELSTGYEVDGKSYQKFLIMRFRHRDSTQHWVAVSGVENDKVVFYDPGRNTTTLDGYTNWFVNGYRIMYATDVEFGNIGVSNLGYEECGGDFVQSYLKWVNNFEGYGTCNYRGRGEGTGYMANIVSGDAGGWTTYPGITMNTGKAIAHRMGYTDWETDIMNQCVDKQQLDKIAPVVVKELFLDKVQEELNSRNISVNTAQMTSLVSVAWGGSDNEVIIMDAYKQYGQNSNELLDAFKNTFGGGTDCNTIFSNGHMKRRLSEYELFMTGNYNSNAESYYRSCSYSAGLSKDEIMSYWPTGK